MTALSISLSFDDPYHSPALPTGLHSMAEIVPHILTRHGISSSDKPNTTQPTLATNATDLSDVMAAGLESALAI
jgi:hypothetical protein